MSLLRAISLLLLLGALAACATTKINYTTASGPRYAGALPDSVAARSAADTVTVASFNIAFAQHVDSALFVLRANPDLRRSDIVLLQEMDETATRRIAAAFGMAYVYYPATLHPRTHRDFGNAILSRFPIVADAKIVLPHISRFRRTRRVAAAATVQVGDTPIRVYCVHLGTMADISDASRRDQLRVVLADAARYPRVILGGDFNNKAVGRMVRDSGYAWPTENGPDTIHFWRWDHIFLKGLAAPDTAATGTVMEVHHASDHRPIWARAVIR